jgi:hypothetical protein
VRNKWETSVNNNLTTSQSLVTHKSNTSQPQVNQKRYKWCTSEVISSQFHHRFISVSLQFHHGFITVSSPFHHHFITVLSPFHHCFITWFITVSSPLYHSFITISSPFHHHFIISSPFYHGFITVSSRFCHHFITIFITVYYCLITISLPWCRLDGCRLHVGFMYRRLDVGNVDQIY